MEMVTILVTWPGPFELFVLLTHKISTWNSASMGIADSQQMFESINLSDLSI